MYKELRTEFDTRQYMVKKDFELYYYSDTKMKTVENHFHNYYELYFFIRGNVLLEINDGSFRLLPRDLVLIPPKTRHRLTVLDQEMPYQRFIFWISASFYKDLMRRSGDFCYLFQKEENGQQSVFHLDVLSFNSIQTRIISLLEEMHTDRFGHEIMVSSYVNQLIMTLSRMVYEKKHPERGGREQSLYQNILGYIETHVTENVSLTQLAKTFFVSKYYISHLFKEQMGLSLHQYLLKKRLSLSKAFLISGFEMQTLPENCGFHDYSTFYRAFRKEFGISPSQFKKSMEKMEKRD